MALLLRLKVLAQYNISVQDDCENSCPKMQQPTDTTSRGTIYLDVAKVTAIVISTKDVHLLLNHRSSMLQPS